MFVMTTTATSASVPFDVCSLESRKLTALFREATSYVSRIRIEMIRKRNGHPCIEKHPAFLVGLDIQDPTIQFVDSLDRRQRIEVIGHELGHLLLLFRSGLRLITRKRPRPGDRESALKYYMNLNKDWCYLLGQIGNTTHHLFLTDYLREEHEMASDVHLRLLHHNFSILANEVAWDLESHYAKGLIAFEYERLIGRVENVAGVSRQPDLFWRAYHSASNHFGNYCFRNIPNPCSHEENVLSFLEDLGYETEDFTFFP
jgi:hypothetical protein